ncbi:nucleotide exchange factor GrpE [Peribacillus kribbensis]|uniref:nucleotide exchange factor GrpE n=1 Tax=Peribacillus kribbensis TaxID=356658 RepID=UPI0003F81CC8|nr:nucleotide exchange factor GrpE [Peribacillus kribbensis]
MTEENKTEQEFENTEAETSKQAEVPFEEERSEELAPEMDEESALQSDAQLKIQDLEAKIEELDNRYLRLQADFDNAKRRARLDMEASQNYRAQSLAADLLPALDNLERAMKIEADNEQTKTLLQGMQMIHSGILEALKKEGIQEIEAVGKEFDPHIHQAVMQVEEEGVESNIVVEEFQKGYMLKDRVIRPSMVKVNQ